MTAHNKEAKVWDIFKSEQHWIQKKSEFENLC